MKRFLTIFVTYSLVLLPMQYLEVTTLQPITMISYVVGFVTAYTLRGMEDRDDQ